MSGLKLAALYGFYPHRLGFCGPQGDSAKKTLSNYLSGKKISTQKIRKILEAFEGAFSYYKLIAKSNGVRDPFDEKVVKAYWVGNHLLEKVPNSLLREMIIKEFSKKGLLSKEAAEEKAKGIPLNSRAHHSFHVLVIGSVTGRVLLGGKLLDLCRVSWGRVMEHKNQKGKNGVVIEHQPLQKKGKRYFLAEPIGKFVFCNKNFIPKIKVGDIVATHWNQVIQILSKKDVINLKKYTQITIESLNN